MSKRTKVFLAGVMQGSRSGLEIENQDYRKLIPAIFERKAPGVEIFDPFAQHNDSVHYDDATAYQVFHEHLEYARGVKVLIAYLPSASMGTAIEIFEAKRSGALVWTITPLHSNWVVRMFSDEIFGSINEFDNWLTPDKLP